MSQPVYGRFDMWQGISTIDLERAREICARLELRGRAEDEVAARAAYLDLIGVTPGERVLDVGCGSGVVTRAMAKRVGPNGMAVGLDPSPALLTVARELAEQEGVGDLVDLRDGCHSVTPSSTSCLPSPHSPTYPTASRPFRSWSGLRALGGGLACSIGIPIR